MFTRDLAIGMIFLSQTVFGILGNFSLLYHYLFLYFTGCRLRTSDFIVEHLIVGNILVIVSGGIPSIILSFGWIYVLNDGECKFTYYIHRVGRGVSIGSTCLLSVFQAITISPRNSKWAELKGKAPKYIGPAILLCWTLQILINIIFPLYVNGKLSNKNITNTQGLGYCSSIRQNHTTNFLFAALLSFPDMFCLGLMLCGSSSMILVLYRHKDRMRHIHRTHICPRSSPESRATKTILLLVSTFVCFYSLSCIFQIYLVLVNNSSWFLVNTAGIVAACFPVISPFLLLSRDSSAFTLCFAWIENTKAPNHTGNT
ncbi:vomeronasal type-1 receptor 4-like [Saimiri boliviensis]|uniref:vomeronasal type-1 receptor 4-like n=1 Tax=Saimiri boliviensis TaxID=27679 RepID=UPI00193E6DE7|nr:vomeronasal type-1 receptor 4-like [Saimiri boliviensis boliviensis]